MTSFLRAWHVNEGQVVSFIVVAKFLPNHCKLLKKVTVETAGCLAWPLVLALRDNLLFGMSRG